MNYPFEVKKLSYDYNALEPYLSKEILEFHHDKHYVTYVNKLNEIIKNYPNLQNMTLEQLLTEPEHIPSEIRTAIKNNAGGVYNHELYFACMSSADCELPTDRLALAINASFGSIENFKAELSSSAINQFGSGYAWLILSNNQLEIISTPNQDTPIAPTVTPLLCIDVWEHAYYLQYQNRRPDYVENWFNLINWSYVGARYMSVAKEQ
ncbi:MAG: superoxide dismutase [Lachnospiraceae bacterium]|nr:superoxide dismutase [Lachnospiraceae bacterium]